MQIKMLPILCCAVLFVGQALGSPAANQYFDTVIHTALQTVIRSDKLDPFHLQDFTFDYQDKILFQKVHGRAEYTEGTLTGLSSVLRHSECQGPSVDHLGAHFVNCTLSFSNLETSYQGRVKYGVMPKVTIKAKGRIQNTMIDVGVVKPQYESTPRVGSFHIRNIGTMDTDFSGLGPLNKHMKVLENNYKEKVPELVRDVINYRYHNALHEAVQNVPLPTA